MTLDEVALQIFCAMMVGGGNVTLYPSLGEKQVEVAFELGKTFLTVAQLRQELFLSEERE